MPTATAEPTQAPALDAQGVARLRELDPGGQLGLVERVLNTYLVSLGRLKDQAAQAWALRDMATVRYAVHTLKSSSASVGAAALAGLCQRIERLAAEGSVQPEVGELMPQMLAEAERVRLAVQRLLPPKGPA